MNLKTDQQSEPRQIHYNPIQLKVSIINATTTVVVAGRAVGKTTGIHGPRTSSCVVKMPGSSNGFISRTYKQFKTRILGSLVAGWKDLGFKEYNEKTGEGHFLIGKRNPNWPTPKYAIGDYSQAIHWFNGSIVLLISQDNPGDANGANIQSLHGDEVFMLDKEDLDENVIPAIRGLNQYSNLVEYGMITFTTSMPLTPDAFWVFDFEKNSDPELNEYIMKVYGQWYWLNQKVLKDKTLSLLTRNEYEIRRNVLSNLLHDLRKDYTYYLEADSFENFHILGEKYFKNQRRILSDEKFNTQILNLRPRGIEIGKRFYPQLAAKHFYIKYNNPYFDSFTYLPDYKDTCLGDADCDRAEPLEMSIDFGGNINSMLVIQDKPDATNVLKEFYAEQPEYLNHLIDKFDKYYSPMVNRSIRLYYDVNGAKRIAQSSETDIEVVFRLLVDKGWEPELIQINFNPLHEDKFEFINLMLSEQDRRIPRLRIHEGNCPNLKVALYNAPIKKNEKGRYVKDKGSEKSGSKTPPKQATHITDALDYYLFRKFRDNISESVTNYAGMTLFS